MIEDVIEIAQEAGREILEIYGSKDFEAKKKQDGSPVTIADERAHELIERALLTMNPSIPVLSEEGSDLKNRKDLNRMWLVDPLDGTKDFLARNGQFTVNIALIEEGEPTMGVIAIPVEGKAYWAVKGKGAFLGKDRLQNDRTEKEQLVAAVSNFHLNELTKNFLELNSLKQTVKIGSSIKFCAFAEGKIDVYPRLAPTMEWDTAAGQIIVEESGGQVLDLTTGKALKYNKASLKNPSFILTRKGLNWKVPHSSV